MLYDGSYYDLAKRLRDDELVSLKLLHDAAAMLEVMGETLEGIVKYHEQYEGPSSSIADYYASLALNTLNFRNR